MTLLELTSTPLLIVPIGPSGSGKSTLFNKLKEKVSNLDSFSFDTLRHEWYDRDNYERAWKASTEDSQFGAKAQQRFDQMLKTGRSIYLDNTNLTPKSRRQFIEKARARGYKSVAYVFNVDIDTLIARQTTRTDKTVPEQAVRQQFGAVKLPQPGEFDQVLSADSV